MMNPPFLTNLWPDDAPERERPIIASCIMALAFSVLAFSFVDAESLSLKNSASAKMKSSISLESTRL